MMSSNNKIVAHAVVLPGGVVKRRRFCPPPALCAVAAARRSFVAALCCALLAMNGITAGMYIKDSNNENVLGRHLSLRQQPFFALPLDDAFGANSATLVRVNPFAEHVVFEKRLAPREVGKRERIIMDAMGGNDYLIKRSSGRK